MREGGTELKWGRPTGRLASGCVTPCHLLALAAAAPPLEKFGLFAAKCLQAKLSLRPFTNEGEGGQIEGVPNIIGSHMRGCQIEWLQFLRLSVSITGGTCFGCCRPSWPTWERLGQPAWPGAYVQRLVALMCGGQRLAALVVSGRRPAALIFGGWRLAALVLGLRRRLAVGGQLATCDSQPCTLNGDCESEIACPFNFINSLHH